jgi:hypothetical protein
MPRGVFSIAPRLNFGRLGVRLTLHASFPISTNIGSWELPAQERETNWIAKAPSTIGLNTINKRWATGKELFPTRPFGANYETAGAVGSI